MPGILTHYFCAKKTLEELKKENITVNETAFLWGAQGPDIFFYNRNMPWNKKQSLKSLGSAFHHSSPSEQLECAAEYVKSTEISELSRSYFLGNICHYATDRTCHPFVRSWVKIYKEQFPEKENFPWHNQIETSLDIIILRYVTGKLPTDISLKSCLPKSREVEEEIQKFWKAVVKSRFDREISEKGAKTLPKDMRMMFGLMNNRLLLKKPFVEVFERLAKTSGKASAHLMGISEGDTDYANVQNEVWNKEENRSEDFFVLFENAVTDGASLIKSCDNALKNGGSFKEITGDIHY